MSTLEEEMRADAAKAQKFAIRNFRIAFWCLLSALVLNGFAVVFVATNIGTTEARAALTAMPGLLILGNQVFKFDLRSRWWWLRHHKVNALSRALREVLETRPIRARATTLPTVGV
jgi:hypothetical protein